MTTVTGYTSQYMDQIVNKTIVSAKIQNGHLIFTYHDGTTLDVGSVTGPTGPKGADGAAFIICTSTTKPVLGAADEGKAIYETDTNLWRIWRGTFWTPQERIICTSTTRPTALSANHAGTEIYETDTTRTYIWSGSRWEIQSPVVCTSSTRPTGLNTNDEGVEIFETDTDRVYFWTGGAWVKDSKLNVLNEVIRTTDSNVVGTTELEFSGNPNYPVTFTAVTGRQYWVEFGYRIVPTLSGISIMFSVWDGAVTSGTKIAHYEDYLLETSGAVWISARMPIILSPGSHTVRFSARCLSTDRTFVVSGSPNWPGFYQVSEVK